MITGSYTYGNVTLTMHYDGESIPLDVPIEFTIDIEVGNPGEYIFEDFATGTPPYYVKYPYVVASSPSQINEQGHTIWWTYESGPLNIGTIEKGQSVFGKKVQFTIPSTAKVAGFDFVSFGVYGPLTRPSVPANPHVYVNFRPDEFYDDVNGKIPIDTPEKNTPQLDEFTVKRCDLAGEIKDDGNHVRVAVKGRIASGVWLGPEDHLLEVGYREHGSTGDFTFESVVVETVDREIDSDFVFDVGDIFNGGLSYEFSCRLINLSKPGYVANAPFTTITKAFANLHLSGSGYGVGIGQYSTATEEDPKFECQYPATFYGGAFDADGNKIGLDLYSTDGIVVGTWIDGKPIYRKVLTFGAVDRGATVDVLTGESAIAEIVSVQAIFKPYNEKVRAPIPWAHQSATASQFRITIQSMDSNPFVRLMTGSSQRADSGHIIIEYTLP